MQLSSFAPCQNRRISSEVASNPSDGLFDLSGIQIQRQRSSGSSKKASGIGQSSWAGTSPALESATGPLSRFPDYLLTMVNPP